MKEYFKYFRETFFKGKASVMKTENNLVNVNLDNAFYRGKILAEFVSFFSKIKFSVLQIFSTIMCST